MRRRSCNRRGGTRGGVCVLGSVCVHAEGGGWVGGGGNKLSHYRKVCSSKSHLPTCTRAMPEGCRVKVQDVPLQSTQITYPLQSINWLLSLLQTLTTLFLFSIDSTVELHHIDLQHIGSPLLFFLILGSL